MAEDLRAITQVYDVETLDGLGGDRDRLDDFRVEMRFEELPAAGWLAAQIVDVDRAFRWGARFVETNMTAAEFLSQRRRAVAVADGLIVDALQPGSLRIRLKPSKRMRKRLRKVGLKEVGLVVAILVGTAEFVDRVTPDHAQQPLPPDIYVIQSPPYVPEHELVIHLRGGDEEIDLVLRAADGSDYRLLEPGPPHRQLPPKPRMSP